MAKVKSMTINTSSFVNDASLAGLVSLEVPEELSPVNDIDIDLFLNHNETHSEEQYYEKDKWTVEKIDNDLSHALSEKAYTPSNYILVKKSVSSNCVSLGSLAENHLEKGNMLGELCFDNFSLSNVLLNDTCDTKTTISNDSSASFDLCLEPEVDFQNKSRKESFDLFLSTLNEKSDSDLSSSLNDILAPRKRDLSKDASEISFRFYPELTIGNTSESYSSEASDELLPDILGPSLSDQPKLIDNLSSELEDLLGSNSSSSSFSSDISQQFLSGTSESSSDSLLDSKHRSGEGTPDLDFIPDINLSFCIREDGKGKLKTFQTEDSGYETDLPSGAQFDKNQDNSTANSSSGRLPDKKKAKPRHSLFSKALSAKPKIDGERKKKLQMIRSRLFINFLDCDLVYDKHENFFTDENVIDHTNECVVMSSFLTFPREN